MLRSAAPLLDRLTKSNKLKSTSSAPSQLAPAQEKILLESTSGDFFGFNTTSFAQRGVLGGIRDSLAGIYDNIVKDYVTDVYTDVIEGYTIATIKLMGWFFFGGFLIAKGAILNGLVDDFGGILLSTITHKHLKHRIVLGGGIIIFINVTIVSNTTGRSLKEVSLTEAVTGRSHGDEPAANYTLPLIEVGLCQFRMLFIHLILSCFYRVLS